MKRRYADRRNNSDITEKELIVKEIHEEDFNGYITLLKIIKTKKEWFVDEENRCILSDGYKWFNIYPTNENYCINAMMNNKNKIVEWYIDISKKIGIENNIPYEDDLYLDIVILPDNRIHILDEDELDNAFNNKQITKEEYDLAYETKKNIIENYGNNIDILKKLTLDLLKKID